MTPPGSPDRPKLISRREFDRLPPRAQGYAVYMQAEWPGSELRDMECPYRQGTDERTEWEIGENIAMLEAQDGVA